MGEIKQGIRTALASTLLMYIPSAVVHAANGHSPTGSDAIMTAMGAAGLKVILDNAFDSEDQVINTIRTSVAVYLVASVLDTIAQQSFKGMINPEAFEFAAFVGASKAAYHSYLKPRINKFKAYAGW